MLSVALSRGSPRVGIADHPAVWSPDLPHRAATARRDRPADSPTVKDTVIEPCHAAPVMRQNDGGWAPAAALAR